MSGTKCITNFVDDGEMTSDLKNTMKTILNSGLPVAASAIGLSTSAKRAKQFPRVSE